MVKVIQSIQVKDGGSGIGQPGGKLDKSVLDVCSRLQCMQVAMTMLARMPPYQSLFREAPWDHCSPVAMHEIRLTLQRRHSGPHEHSRDTA